VVGKERALEILGEALRASGGDQAEARLVSHATRLTRYANSVIHQNVAESNARLTVKVYLGKKMGRASTNVLDKESIKKTAEKAREIARMSKENPEFRSLPGPRPIPEVKSYFESTAAAGPDLLADNVMAVIRKAKEKGFDAAGAHSTSVSETAVANSLGVRAYGASTMAELTTVLLSNQGSGYAEAMSRNVEDISPEKVADEAVGRCQLNRDQIALEPGEYPVVLDIPAAADMVRFLSSMGFSALAYQDGRSFLCGKMGQEIVSPLINIWDDGLDPLGAPFAFDAEGQPKSRVVLIERGVAKGVVYDSYAAFKEGKKESTGHAGYGLGGQASNLFVSEGDLTRDQLISGLERGILVTRFHYVRPVHSQRTIITGMTRDGTFLIKNGRIDRALFNLRFTQSIVGALAGCDGLGKERKLSGLVVAPAMRLRKFDFTGRAGH